MISTAGLCPTMAPDLTANLPGGGMDKVWEAVIITVICGLGPVWDDFMKEVNLRVGLGLWQTWQRFSVGTMGQKG